MKEVNDILENCGNVLEDQETLRKQQANMGTSLKTFSAKRSRKSQN